MLAAEQARRAVLGEDAAATAVALVERAEAEAAEMRSDAEVERESAAARAVELIAKAELEAEEIAVEARASAHPS